MPAEGAHLRIFQHTPMPSLLPVSLSFHHDMRAAHTCSSKCHDLAAPGAPHLAAEALVRVVLYRPSVRDLVSATGSRISAQLLISEYPLVSVQLRPAVEVPSASNSPRHRIPWDTFPPFPRSCGGATRAAPGPSPFRTRACRSARAARRAWRAQAARYPAARAPIAVRGRSGRCARGRARCRCRRGRMCARTLSSRGRRGRSGRSRRSGVSYV